MNKFEQFADTKDKSVILAEAAKHEIKLTEEQIDGPPGDFHIEGLPWDRWLHEMTMD
ncbi:hypothetical protein [Streptomyces sp. PA5.6]|uniref:hypothetical protein n=1 Tax=Streptomyces sp. PA5.6 TaxID=3035651 RepID=UPI0039047116